MKKFLLSAALISSAILGTNAQVLSFLDKEGKNIANGSTYVFEGYDEEELIPGMVIVTVNPAISVTSSADATITVQTTLIKGEGYQLCAGGNCVSGNPASPVITKNNVSAVANKAIDLELEAILNFYGNDPVVVPFYEILVEAWYNSNPSNKVSFTLNMGNVGDAGVDHITADGSSVTVIGKELKYDVIGSASVNVYSLSGKTVVSKTVSGNGSISLGNLPKGVYMYKVSGKAGRSGKFIIK